MSLKELRRRITSVKSTQKITAAMKMVASAKLRRIQERVGFGAEYLERLNTIGYQLGKIDHDLETLSPWLSTEGARDLIIVFGAEKGLCGSFNSNFARYANQVLTKNLGANTLIFGAKTFDSLKAMGKKNITFDPSSDKPTMQTFLQLARSIEQQKKVKAIGKVFIVASQFKNILTQKNYLKRLCPLEFEGKELQQDTFLIEPSPEVFLPHFCLQYVAASLHQSWLETQAGEMASRMTAMDNATKNAKDMLGALSLKYNRTRQAQITTELNEIIAGSEGAQQ